MINLSILSILLFACSPAPASAAGHGFTFAVPDIEGWAEIPVKDSGDGVVIESLSADGTGNFNAVVEKGRVTVTDALVSQMRDTMAQELAAKGVAGAQVLEAGIVDIGGVPCLRMVSKGTFSGIPLNQLIYVMPGKDHYASLTYTSNQEYFEARVPAFDESAKRTKGLARNVSTGSYVLYGALLGGLAQLLYVLYKKMSA